MAIHKDHPYNKYKQEVLPVLLSKAEEFYILGYDRASIDEVWDCLIKKVWKKAKDGDRHIHEIVQDILRLSSSNYISYLTVEAFKGPDLFVSDEAAASFEELLKDEE